MPDCCGPGSARYEDVFDGDFAHEVAGRYRRRGLTAPERRIVEHLAAQDLSDRTVLEIGGGEATAPVSYSSGFAKGTARPFAVATGGRGTLSTALGARR